MLSSVLFNSLWPGSSVHGILQARTGVHLVIWSLFYILCPGLSYYNVNRKDRVLEWNISGLKFFFISYRVTMRKFLSLLMFSLFWGLIKVNLLNCGKSSVGKNSLYMPVIPQCLWSWQVLCKWKVFFFSFCLLLLVNRLLIKHSFFTIKNLYLEEDGSPFPKGLISFCKI